MSHGHIPFVVVVTPGRGRGVVIVEILKFVVASGIPRPKEAPSVDARAESTWFRPISTTSHAWIPAEINHCGESCFERFLHCGEGGAGGPEGAGESRNFAESGVEFANTKITACFNPFEGLFENEIAPVGLDDGNKPKDDANKHEKEREKCPGSQSPEPWELCGRRNRDGHGRNGDAFRIRWFALQIQPCDAGCWKHLIPTAPALDGRSVSLGRETHTALMVGWSRFKFNLKSSKRPISCPGAGLRHCLDGSPWRWHYRLIGLGVFDRVRFRDRLHSLNSIRDFRFQCWGSSRIKPPTAKAERAFPASFRVGHQIPSPTSKCQSKKNEVKP